MAIALDQHTETTKRVAALDELEMVRLPQFHYDATYNDSST